MKIQLIGKDLANAISCVMTVTGNKDMVLRLEDRKVYLMSSGKEAMVKLLVPNASADKGTLNLGIDSSMVQGVISRKADIEFEVSKDSSTIKFKSNNKGKYDGSIVTIPAEDIPEINIDEGSAISFTEEVRTILNKAIPSVAIENVFNTEDMSLCVSLGKKGIKMACVDQWHLAFYEKAFRYKGKAVEFSIATATLGLINTLTDKPYSLSVADSRVYAFNKSFKVALPLLQAENQPTFDLAERLARSLGDKVDTRFFITKDELEGSMENLSAVLEEGAPAILAYEGDKEVKFGISTNYGKIKNIIEVDKNKWKDKKTIYQIAPPVLLDLLRITKGSHVEVKLTDKFLHYKESNEDFSILYACSLL